MKSTLTIIGTASATAALLSFAAFAQDPAKPGVQQDPARPATQSQSDATAVQSTESQIQLEGKIVSLFEYLSGEHASASPRSVSPVSPSTAPAPGQRLGQQDTTATDAERSTDILGRDRSAETRTAPSGAFSGTAAWAGQPLALVVESSHAGAASAIRQAASAVNSAIDPSRPSAATSATSPSQTPSSSYASSQTMGGDVYVLVFDPQDASSRAAFTKAQWMASGRAGGSSTSDRLPVRGPGETDPNRPGIAPERDRDPSRTDTTRTDPSRLEQSDLTPSSSARTYSSVHSMGKKVKVTGSVLNKGGIKAIEVASIEDASEPSSSTTDTLRSTTPRTTPTPRIE
jgi:hypothetical protein